MTTPLSAQTIALVKATIPALAEHGPRITEAMYRRLFQDPEIARLFNQANQRSGAQRFALAGAVLAYAQNIDNLGALAGAVERIAQKHVGYAILPEHYPHVATALLGAISEVLGDAATPEILEAWGEAYWFLANILIAREGVLRDDLDAAPGGWTGWRRFVIAERRDESDTITSFTLSPEDGGKVIPHRPGQYLTLRFETAGLPGVIRNYSVSCAPNADHYRITVKREPQGEASRFLHDQLAVGAVLECTAPAGDFQLPSAPARPVVLLSGGVGLTPMVSMLAEIAGNHPDLAAYYIHGTTSRETHALDHEIRAFAQSHGQTTVATFYERPAPADNVNTGFVTMDWLHANVPLRSADIYLCGPKPFLRHFVGELAKAGVPADRIHYEFFGPADEVLAA
ncbi:MAG TPA: NO-inducible flavohemoprotein [Paracoccus sp. (in: a-proteobacteria)]|uniref:NO-inducible flavohemoprotein n=1 Tax=Paracoccus sp. TaxID=267 RepID=UPI002CA2E777|nr:NO-inducible flavohemoprotein [Paracoccus sp. (in: a-proteobacteria)]HWL58860.1 NO-inducible flavohemoprotein [Paracoccus sp. (in: a-proteobacteria)]